jgi:exonuclease-1
MLLFFGVTPYLVFDGDNLPSKAGTESSRLQRREESKQIALELYNKGRMSEAHLEFQKAVDVTPYMARVLIEELKRLKVQYVVAPYEADSQLVYLERQGIINGIISEDSDLLVFGAKRLLSKLDQHGDCIEINRGDFTACRDISLIGWTDADFRRMCILSGCDYLPNIPKMGLKTAYRNMRKYKNVEKVLKVLQFEGQYQIPATYLYNFKQAERTFLYQRVFCPKSQKLVTLTPLDAGVNVDEMPFIGADVEPEIAIGVACGDIDPMTKTAINLKPSFASRAMPALARRQTLASATELKSSKPISSFFTPKRMPLAELDPNSLTPSPSQQRLLERHANNAWDPSPVPAHQSLTRSASSASLVRPSGSPMVRTAEREAFLSRAARISTVPSAKRQRLCSDTDEETLPTPPGQLRSHFFEIAGAGSSPSGQKVTRTKKSRKSNFGVFSDELAEDIMCQLTEVPENIDLNNAVTAEATASISQETVVVSDLPSNGARDTGTEITDGRDSARTDDEVALADQKLVATSVGADEHPELFDRALEAHVQKQNASLLAKFAFSGQTDGPDSATATNEEQAAPTVNTPSTASRTPTLSAGDMMNRSALVRRRLTPLQRLGQTALAKSRSMDNLGFRKMLAATNRDSGYESDFAKDSSRETTAALTKTTVQGSEDQIVPGSDEESEEACGQPVATLDLQRFSFVPK